MALGVGVIGCGNIAPHYLRNLQRFAAIRLRALADLDLGLARQRGADFGLPALTPKALLARKDIGIVLNLTPPLAHAEVTKAALVAGKHVYSEKPLGVTLAEAQDLAALARARGLTLGVAPDTFLGAAHQAARRLLDAGAIGTVSSGTAFFLSAGMEAWHPNPGFFFRRGGGPMLDMAPYSLTLLVNLLGPVARVTAMAATPRTTRRVTAPGPMQGQEIAVEVPTSLSALLGFASGAQILLGISWDVMAHSLPHVELYGSAGTLRLADPDQFGGALRLNQGAGWDDIGSEGAVFGGPEGKWTDYRGLGLAEMALALTAGRPPRAGLAQALHVLEVIEALGEAASSGAPRSIASRCDRAEPLPAEDIALRPA